MKYAKTNKKGQCFKVIIKDDGVSLGEYGYNAYYSKEYNSIIMNRWRVLAKRIVEKDNGEVKIIYNAQGLDENGRETEETFVDDLFVNEEDALKNELRLYEDSYAKVKQEYKELLKKHEEMMYEYEKILKYVEGKGKYIKMNKTTVITSGYVEKDTLFLTSVCSRCNTVVEEGQTECSECKCQLIWDHPAEIERFFKEAGAKWKRIRK